MTDTELLALADTVRDFVEEQVRTACAPLVAEIAELREHIRTMTPARDGKDADPELVRAAITTEIEHQLNKLTAPESPVVDMAAVEMIIQREIRAAVDEIPPAKDGRDGTNGRDGLDGKDGSPGINGRDGVDGKDGQSIKGDPGDRGLDGQNGKDGLSITGERGKDGINGRDGADGRDALQLEILPSLERSRSVPRGTVARHAGGLMRAFRDTDPSKDGDGPLEKFGWECVWDGISSIELIQNEDIRSFAIQITMTSGKSTAAQFRTPVLLYRGIWEAGEFSRGDAVTYDGSVWHCELDGTKEKPGISKDWKLIVKRGQNGKDFRPNEPPKPGPVSLK